ncbi:copper chaperone PCu(A)C [Rhodocyclus tenuis]|uniref:Copper chaperone PCu(A)C n=1 Tax=Rhodocyclus tenuis TaxID=1066 RepID=A0A840G5X1_RHOTE|nr:copper chaperone PCu(A)C [Rhodocyclus tenuis]MBB4247763.1 hypothetical protein [Rhodocyclus tenuis]
MRTVRQSRSPFARLIPGLLALALPCAFASLPAQAADDAAHAQHASGATISVVDPYVRLSPPAAVATGAFMVLRNDSDSPRRLVRAESTAAKTVELHNHIDENGVMKMRAVKDIEIPAKGSATLKPGSYHVMLIDLTAPLKEGERLPITLRFDDGSTQTIAAPVRSIASTMAPMPHGNMQH